MLHVWNDYLPAFTPKMAPMEVNIPYIEHLGMGLSESRECTL